MAQRGDRFEMPDGTVFTVTEAGVDTGGDRVQLEVTVPADAFSPPAHIHPQSVDEFQVLQGTFEVMLDGTWRTFEQGDVVSVPSGTMHTLRNTSGEAVRLNNVHRPPVRFEEFLEHAHRLMHAKGIKNAKDVRAPIYFSMLTLEYPDTLVPARRRDRLMTKTLAGIGRMLGWRTAT